ncbi:MAG: alpha-hydroxy acid oxidase [Pseudolabrys sp.]
MDTTEFDALERQAEQKLPPPSWAFCVTGADDEISAAENVEAWRDLRLRPRVLNDIVDVDTSTALLGESVAAPILVAPTGRHKLFHPQGERATARGAAAANALYVLAAYSNVAMEEVAAERRSAPQWFQLYLLPDRSDVEAMIERVAANGFTALILTVDSQLYGWSPRASRAPYIPTPEILNINIPGSPMALSGYDPSYKGKVLFPTTWRDLEWLVKRSPLPVIVKGVMRGDDAARCVDLGAKAVIVSNHGGRHLDTTVTTAAALQDVVEAVGGRAEIYVDSGIRRGTDIVKALALGARAVLVGRPPIWGLAVNGADGVAAVMTHLHEELIRAMRLCGVARLADIGADLVARPPAQV